jgi:hypothetical protein
MSKPSDAERVLERLERREQHRRRLAENGVRRAPRAGRGHRNHKRR